MALAAAAHANRTRWDAVRAHRSLLRVAKLIVNLGVAAALCSLLFLGVGPRIFGYHTETMLTSSMVPYIHPGDVAVVVPEPISAVRVGQVLTYQAPLADHRIVSHRVVRVIHTAAGLTEIRTKGDANPLPDPWTAQMHGTTAWRVVAVVPHLGNLIRLLRTRLVFLISVWVLPGLLAVCLLASIWRKPTEAN